MLGELDGPDAKGKMITGPEDLDEVLMESIVRKLESPEFQALLLRDNAVTAVVRPSPLSDRVPRTLPCIECRVLSAVYSVVSSGRK